MMFGRIQAIGQTIKVWYLPRDDVQDPFAESATLGDPIITLTDSTHQHGNVGIWHESMSNSAIDNVLVTGPNGFATGTLVDPKGKAASLWGSIKANK